MEMDVDSDGSVSFNEFADWLSEWLQRMLDTGSSSSQASGVNKPGSPRLSTDKAKSLQKSCKKAFDKVHGGSGGGQRASMSVDDGLSLSQFSDFMAHGVVKMLQQAGLWDAMSFANLFDICGFDLCFDRYDADGNGVIDTRELTTALLDLDLHPSPREIEGELCSTLQSYSCGTEHCQIQYCSSSSTSTRTDG